MILKNDENCSYFLPSYILFGYLVITEGVGGINMYPWPFIIPSNTKLG